MSPCIEYKAWNPTAATYSVVEQAVEIIDEYTAAGYDLTLRQLYYQFVARDLLPNTSAMYDRLGRIVDRARLAGWIDWDTIVDRTRNLHELPNWSSPSSIVGVSANSFRTDRWARQPERFEVWVEKEALAGVFRRVCDELQVPLFPCRGYPSQSSVWRAARRLQEHDGQEVTILHFGDHDASGIDMTRDILDRQNLFDHVSDHPDEGLVNVERLALNMDQVEQYGPPPNPAKQTDPRAKDYTRVHGDESWELDALEPAVLEELVRERVLAGRDEALWQQDREEDEEARRSLSLISERFDDAVRFLRNGRAS